MILVSKPVCIADSAVLVTHGNWMALLLRSLNERFGFDEWRSLTNPDIYRVLFTNPQGGPRSDRPAAAVERIWTE